MAEHFFHRPRSREEILADDPLREYFVWWDELLDSEATVFRECLINASNESALQLHFQQHPICLVQHLSGGHGRWVIPQVRFGSEYVADFVIGQKDSTGFRWQLVELESPHAKMFNKNGDPSRTLNHAMRQINSWRVWLSFNQNYAARKLSDGGLGLTDIQSNVPGMIIIGRRCTIKESDNALRRHMISNSNIEIHSYDYILDGLECR